MITKDKWAEIIKDFHQKELPQTIEREIIIPLDIPIERAISIIGPRRTGKTYEMYNLIKKIIKTEKKEQVIYINFEKVNVKDATDEDLIKMLETFYEIYPENRKKKVWLFLDEIQNVINWEKFVRTSLDENLKVYISGSSSKLLSKEIATSMRGRNITYAMYPFSFKEYLQIKSINYPSYISSAEKSEIKNALADYINYGGYPEAVLFPSEKEKILSEILETTIFKDVIERENIRNIKAMRLLITGLINSKEFSVYKFYNFLKSNGIKIGKNVLYNYIEYLNDAFFVFMLKKFSFSYKELEQSIPKSFFIDNGFLKVNGINDKARLMENCIFVELKRKDSEIYYWKSALKEEIDFIIKKGNKIKQLIQVCYNIEDFNTKERELKALIKGSKELKCNNLLVITDDKEGEEIFKQKKIKFIPLWKWLLA